MESRAATDKRWRAGRRRSTAGGLSPRSGGQAQFSALLAAQALDSEPVRDLLAWMPEHLDEDLSVPGLARRLNLSERQFRRVFKAQVGMTPGDYVEGVHLEAACRLLETTQGPIGHIASLCGFGAAEIMNRTFQRRLDTTPGEHRHHFGVASEEAIPFTGAG